MNQPRRTVLAAFMAITTLIVPLAALAASSDQPSRQDHYQAGQAITVGDSVTGDAYLAGREMVVNGAVAGSVYAAGSTLVINGTVGGNVYAIVGNIEIVGNVSGNVYAFGSDVHLRKDTTVAGNAFLAGSRIALDGTVGGYSKLAAAEVALNGTVTSYADAGTTTLRLGKDSKVGGNLNYWSDTDLVATPGTSIGGATTRHNPPQLQWGAAARDNLERGNAIWGFIWLLATLIAAAVLMKLFPLAWKQGIDQIAGKPGQTILTGMAVLFIAPVAGILLTISILGIPLGLTIFGAYFLLLFVGPIVAALWIGQQLARLLNQPVGLVAATTAGLLLLWILGFVPVLGGLMSLLASALGIGAITKALWASRKPPLPVVIASK